MAPPTEFVRFVLDLLSRVGEVRVRAMFGGFGLYYGDAIFAIIVGDRLYFRTDAVSARNFEKLGLGPFTYVARGRTIALKYHEAPPEALESPEIMRSRALEAISVARRAPRRKNSAG